MTANRTPRIRGLYFARPSERHPAGKLPSGLERKIEMPDDKSKAGKQDRDRINVHENYELRNWSKKFGVSKEELKKAVQSVGSSAEAVRRHFGK